MQSDVEVAMLSRADVMQGTDPPSQIFVSIYDLKRLRLCFCILLGKDAFRNE